VGGCLEQKLNQSVSNINDTFLFWRWRDEQASSKMAYMYLLHNKLICRQKAYKFNTFTVRLFLVLSNYPKLNDIVNS